MVGRPPTVVPRCQVLQQKLFQKGVKPGMKVKRNIWTQFVQQAFQLSTDQANTLTKSGAGMGFWSLTPQQGRLPGSVILNEPVQD